MQQTNFKENLVKKANIQYIPPKTNQLPIYSQPRRQHLPTNHFPPNFHSPPIYIPPNNPYHDPFRNINQSITRKSSTWSEIQKILAKPVYYPSDASTNISQRYINSQRDATQYAYPGSNRSRIASNKIISSYKEEYTPNPPPPQARISYIPYTKKYYQYQPREIIQTIHVPVQKQITQYYTIEHLTDYLMKQVEDTVVDYIPQPKINLKIQYLPIEQHIMYIPQHTFKPTNAQSLAVSQVQLFKQGQPFISQNNASRVISQPVFYPQPLINMHGGLYPQGPPSPRKVQFGQPIQRTQKNIQPSAHPPANLSSIQLSFNQISDHQIYSNSIQQKLKEKQIKSNLKTNTQGFNNTSQAYKFSINDSFRKEGIPQNQKFPKPQSQGFNEQ